VRSAIGKIAHRDHRRDLAANGHGIFRDGEEIVQRTAFVGLDVRKADVA